MPTDFGPDLSPDAGPDFGGSGPGSGQATQYLHGLVNLTLSGDGQEVVLQALPSDELEPIVWTLTVDSGTVSIPESTAPTATLYDLTDTPIASYEGKPLTGWDDPGAPSIRVYHAPDLTGIPAGVYILRISPLLPVCSGDSLSRRVAHWAVLAVFQ